MSGVLGQSYNIELNIFKSQQLRSIGFLLITFHLRVIMLVTEDEVKLRNI